MSDHAEELEMLGLMTDLCHSLKKERTIREPKRGHRTSEATMRLLRERRLAQ